MNNESETTHKSKLSKKTIIWVVTFGVTALIIFLAFFIPLSMSDGTEKFEGAEKESALQVIRDAPRLSGNMERFTRAEIAYQVEDVYEAPQSTAKSWCGVQYQEGKKYYSVVVGVRTFFGIKLSEASWQACIPAN